MSTKREGLARGSSTLRIQVSHDGGDLSSAHTIVSALHHTTLVEQHHQPHSLYRNRTPKMRNQLSPPLQALYRVFILPTLQQTTTRPLQTRIAATTLTQQNHTPTRPFSSTNPYLATRPPEKRTQLWDEEIWAKRIALVDPTTKALLAPQTLRSALQDLDRKTHRLVCVTAPPPPKHPSDPTPQVEWIPTVRVMSKKEQYEAEKLKKAAKVQAKKNEAGGATKTIEMNWAIDGNDLAHRMKRMREFLKEGRKVEVVLAKRKGGRKATVEECEGLVERIVEGVEEVAGAKEVKKMDGKLAGVATLFFEGKKSAGAVVEEKVAKEAAA